MSAPRGDAPSLGVLVTGGIGVLMVVAFVGAVVLRREGEPRPGDRVAVVRDASPAGLAVLAARCPDERVKAVEVRVADGAVLWRITSDRGTIDRRFAVGAEPPAFFATQVPLQPFPPGPLEVEVVVDDVVDFERFDPGALEDRDVLGAPCGGTAGGLVPLAFVAGGAGVVVAYGSMVRRFLHAR